MWKCKHCQIEFELTTTSEKANHSRWCHSNPRRTAYVTSILHDRNARFLFRVGELKDFEVECSNCNTPFLVREREKCFPQKKQYFCSRSCANTRNDWHIGRGIEPSSARTICFKHHCKACVVCGEQKIVAVHHLDEDHANNDPSNLIPMCPTHHQYWHSRYRDEVYEIVMNYIKNWGHSSIGRI